MGSPTVTSMFDLSGVSREAPVDGLLVLNGASFRVQAEGAEQVVKVINRHTGQSAVTASLTGPGGAVAGSTQPASQYLVLTSADDPLTVNAEPNGFLGVYQGTVRGSTAAPGKSAGGFFSSDPGFKPTPSVAPSSL